MDGSVNHQVSGVMDVSANQGSGVTSSPGLRRDGIVNLFTRAPM